MKSKKLLLVIVLLILIVGSLAVTALRNPFRVIGDTVRGLGGRISGATGKVGGPWGLTRMGVNALIIAVVLYFGLNLIPYTRPKNRSGQVLMVVIVIILGIIFAIQIGDRFIWKEGVVRSGVNYLFKASYENEDGETVYGILHPTHIWKFILLSLIASWFLTNFIKVGKTNQIFDVAVAVIICANAVHNGVTLIRVIHIVQMLTWFILAVQFSSETFKELPGGNVVRWFVAIAAAGILIGWISSIIVPGTFPLRGGDKKTLDEAAEEAEREGEIMPGTSGWSWGKLLFIGVVLMLSAATSGLFGGITAGLFGKIRRGGP